jgi:hypothetical protein
MAINNKQNEIINSDFEQLVFESGQFVHNIVHLCSLAVITINKIIKRK